MVFYSTNNFQERVSFREAVLEGIARDGGLYMPVEIPSLPQEFFSEIDRLSLPDLSFQVARAFLGGAIDEQELEQIVFDSLGVDAPLAEVTPGVFALELLHEPTWAFKEFGARFLAMTRVCLPGYDN